MNKFNDIWVYIDETDKVSRRISIELLAKAQEIAKEAGMKAVPVVLPEGSYAPEAIVRALKSAVVSDNPFAILFGFTPLGKELSAALTASMDLGIASDCSNIIYRKSENDLMFIRPTFDSKLNATITLKTYPQIASFSAGVFPLNNAEVNLDTNKKVLSPSGDLSALKQRFVEFIENQDLSDTNIEEADVLIAGGRGVGSAEGFELLRELARLLGGNIAASRGAVDDGYISKDYVSSTQDIQVLAPMYKTLNGIDLINSSLQNVFNPQDNYTINLIEESKVLIKNSYVVTSNPINTGTTTDRFIQTVKENIGHTPIFRVCPTN